MKFLKIKNNPLSAVLFTFFITAVCSINTSAKSIDTTPSRPNIILVMSDDQGYGDLSAHGSPDVSTPNIDKLAQQGVSFSDFHGSPTCSPARAALMSGKHSFKTGVTHTIFERERMALGTTTLAEVLKSVGYSTSIHGKWHLGEAEGYRPQDRGFDEVFIHGAGGIGQNYPGAQSDVPDNSYFNPIILHNKSFVKTQGFCTDVFFEQSLNWMKKRIDDKQPFFSFIATNAPHSPWYAPEVYKKKFADKGYNVNEQGFYGMIENIDDNVGKLLAKLEEWQVADNTIVIYMSDNGKPGRINPDQNKVYNAGLRGYKSSAYEGGTRVPFIVKWPQQFSSNIAVDQLTAHYDILPTLAEITGADISGIKDLDGRSLLPLLKADQTPWQDRFHISHVARWKKHWDPETIKKKDIRKYVRKDGVGTTPEENKYRKSAIRNERFKLVNGKELYDLNADPAEANNIAAQHPKMVTQFLAYYNAWWDKVRPLMINEDANLNVAKPHLELYLKQQQETGIPALTTLHSSYLSSPKVLKEINNKKDSLMGQFLMNYRQGKQISDAELELYIKKVVAKKINTQRVFNSEKYIVSWVVGQEIDALIGALEATDDARILDKIMQLSDYLLSKSNQPEQNNKYDIFTGKKPYGWLKIFTDKKPGTTFKRNKNAQYDKNEQYYVAPLVTGAGLTPLARVSLYILQHPETHARRLPSEESSLYHSGDSYLKKAHFYANYSKKVFNWFIDSPWLEQRDGLDLWRQSDDIFWQQMNWDKNIKNNRNSAVAYNRYFWFNQALIYTVEALKLIDENNNKTFLNKGKKIINDGISFWKQHLKEQSNQYGTWYAFDYRQGIRSEDFTHLSFDIASLMTHYRYGYSVNKGDIKALLNTFENVHFDNDKNIFKKRYEKNVAYKVDLNMIKNLLPVMAVDPGFLDRMLVKIISQSKQKNPLSADRRFPAIAGRLLEAKGTANNAFGG